jgi:mono/diheme cytochrome c family protein
LAALAIAAVIIAPRFPTRGAVPADPVTFSAHIAPIVFENCTGCHHPGEAVPFTLMNYDEVKQRGRTIAAVTERRYMPPWHGASEMGHFRDERRLTDEQIKLIRTWVDNGMPAGDLSKVPPTPRYTEGWRLGPPDLVVKMDQSFEVPASGPDLFRNFAIKLNLRETKWVRAIDFRPSARVSHHAIFFLDSSGEAMRQQSLEKEPGFAGMSFLTASLASRGLEDILRAGTPGQGGSSQIQLFGLGVWTVGASPHPLPEGLARPVAAGSDLVLQMHFHPTGKVEREQATIGFYFADKPPVKTLTQLVLPAAVGFFSGLDLPPGGKNISIRDSFTMPVDVDVVAMTAHAHYLATKMTMKATPPGGATRVLAGVPKWDFNWQDRYTFMEPVRLPRGTLLEVEIQYDNSADNPNNPRNPPQRVLWGEQSTDEMGGISLELVAAREEDLPAYNAAMIQHALRAALNGMANGAKINPGALDGLLGVRGGRSR